MFVICLNTTVLHLETSEVFLEVEKCLRWQGRSLSLMFDCIFLEVEFTPFCWQEAYR